MARRNPLMKRTADDAKIAQSAADKYIAGQNYSESSMEAVRRASAANKYNPRTKVRVGNYQEPADSTVKRKKR